MNSKNKIYILERLENAGTDEDKDVYRHCDEGEYSIEHIMPQHLTPAWVKSLGPDSEEIHEIWLHRIANLTLTAYNSKYSNSSFEEKKTMAHGFADSGIRMNTYIAKKVQWTLLELEERDAMLKAKALQIWPAPDTNYAPAEKELDSCTLADEEPLTGRLIAKFSFQNTEQPVMSWVEMYQKVLQILYSEDKTIITKLAVSTDDNLAIHFSLNPGDFTKYAEIGDGILVWTNTDTQSKLSVLRRLFRLYGIDPDDLAFYLREDNEPSCGDHDAREEQRIRYWTKALQEIHKDLTNKCFDNVSPSKGSWINGYFGVSGFCICCVANYSLARVELYLGGKRERNKEAFDMLLKHKSEIESALECRLVWHRNDEGKSSKVYFELQDVSIEKESDWDQMAAFHAMWSRKFYEVLVPYLVKD